MYEIFTTIWKLPFQREAIREVNFEKIFWASGGDGRWNIAVRVDLWRYVHFLGNIVFTEFFVLLVDNSEGTGCSDDAADA